MNIAIGNDHTAFGMKKYLSEHMAKRGLNVVDCGSDEALWSDYPHYAEIVSGKVVGGDCERGVLICGTGIGMSLAANKIAGVRAAVCSEPYSAKYSRTHNDSNILCLGVRVVAFEFAAMILDVWLDSPFDGGRHQKRVDMIMDIERRART